MDYILQVFQSDKNGNITITLPDYDDLVGSINQKANCGASSYLTHISAKGKCIPMLLCSFLSMLLHSDKET
jgi:hypothetical protein